MDYRDTVVAVGSDAVITRFARRQTRSGTLRLLTPTDCVRDRLAAWYHWHDPQALEQALLVGVRHSLALGVIREWSVREGMAEGCAEFQRELARRRARARRSIPARRRSRCR